MDARWMLLCASLAIGSACAFESSGVPGSGSAGASVGSASSGSGDATAAGTDNGASVGSTAEPSTTAGDEPPAPPPGDTDGGTGPVVGESSGAGTTGSLDPSGAVETGTTDAQESGAASSDGGVANDPYYGDCTNDDDCAPGTCFTTNVIDAPDAAVCLLPCGEGCPAPMDGEAQPICTLSDDCALSCGPAIDCPSGMECYTFESAQGAFYRCLWPQPA